MTLLTRYLRPFLFILTFPSPCLLCSTGGGFQAGSPFRPAGIGRPPHHGCRSARGTYCTVGPPSRGGPPSAEGARPPWVPLGSRHLPHRRSAEPRRTPHPEKRPTMSKI